jgi:hypothetical protein
MGELPVSASNIGKLISELGFPVIMCLWMMWRSDKRDQKMLLLLSLIAQRLKIHEGDKPGDL